jgi:2-hydroxychromene-2-carboxylate isomerase
MAAPQAAFYFDLGSPQVYLAAEQVLQTFAGTGVAVEWQPVLAEGLDGDDEFVAARCREEQDILRLDVERRARELSLQPLRWPATFPFDSRLAMRVATYAKSIGRTVPFAQAAFRQAFAGGRSLAEEDSVLIAAAACEMHPAAVLQGAGLRSVAQQLEQSTGEARAAGVRSLPAVRVHEQVFHGERALAQAASAAREEVAAG